MRQNQKKQIGYFVILVLLGLMAIWVFHKPDHLRKLKETELVTAGTEEPIAFVQEAVKLIDAKNKQKLIRIMYSPEPNEFERKMGHLLKGKFGPVEVLGCRRLTHSHREGNISVCVKSVPLGKMYAFSLQKNKKGEYRIYSVSVTKRDPRKQEK